MSTISIKNCGGTAGDILLSKGHHAPEEFMAAALACWGEPLEGFSAPAHVWLRAVPDRLGEYASVYIDAEPHARGAFPATFIERY